MIDREKIIKGLETCSIKTGALRCLECPYTKEERNTDKWCTRGLHRDILALLKEQDKTIKSLTEEKERLLSERIAELRHNIDALHAVMQDTILVNNAIEQKKGG